MELIGYTTTAKLYRVTVRVDRKVTFKFVVAAPSTEDATAVVRRFIEDGRESYHDWAAGSIALSTGECISHHTSDVVLVGFWNPFNVQSDD